MRAAAPVMRTRPSTDPRETHVNELLVRYHRHGDLDARDEVIARFLPLARQLASRYRHTSEPADDLTQVACVGLMKAIERFEPGRGSRFVSFAHPTMLGELKRHFRDKGWAVHVSRGLQEHVREVRKTRDGLLESLGRSPRLSEIAASAGLSTDAVSEALQAAGAYDSVSLDSRLSPGKEDDGTLMDGVADEERGFERTELALSIKPTLSSLPERERQILRLRFLEDLTQSEIGERVGISQMHVSRLMRRSLETLRAELA